jgi:hypothetical protein
MMCEMREQHCFEKDINSEHVVPTKYLFWASKSPKNLSEIVADVKTHYVSEEFQNDRDHVLAFMKKISNLDIDEDEIEEYKEYFNGVKAKIDRDRAQILAEQFRQKMKMKKREYIKKVRLNKLFRNTPSKNLFTKADKSSHQMVLFYENVTARR